MTEQTPSPQPRSRRGLRWAVAGLVVWVLILAAGIVAVFSGGGEPTSYAGVWDEERFRAVAGGGEKVVMIDVAGEIVGGSSEGGIFGEGPMGADDYISQLEQAREDDDVKGVVVRLETPGGAVVASDQIYDAVREVAADKPVVALMGDTAASGGYYIAAAANHIVANPATVTGSIGVIAIFPNLEGTARKLGVRPIVIKSGRLKDMGSPFRDMSREERRVLQRLIDEAYGRFVERVAAGRKMSEERVRQIADGRIYSGRQAQRAGLVDQLGDLDEAVSHLRRDPDLRGRGVTVVRYTRTVGLGDALFGLRNGDVGRSLRDAIADAGADLARVPRRTGLHYLWLG